MANLIDMRHSLGFEVGNEPIAGQGPVRVREERGRGAVTNLSGRHEAFNRYLFDDGWQSLEDMPGLKTEVTDETAKTIITRNQSPDISFDRSINPYRGCEHGCSYCYARPSHANMGLSPGLDFESRLFAKTNAPEVLRRELMHPAYKPKTIALGANTDPYQPIEKQYRLTREILKVLSEFGHPVGIVTKSALVLRDIDILQNLAERGLVKVALSITTLDAKLARSMEPRAATPTRRLHALEVLSQAGIPTAVMAAPLIPGLNDSEIEAILKAASVAGAKEAGYVLLRLPLEVREVFFEWIMNAYPDRARHVLSLVRATREGKENDATWRRRQTGSGPYAWALGRRFEMTAKRLGLNKRKLKLTTEHFTRPAQPGEQLRLL